MTDNQQVSQWGDWVSYDPKDDHYLAAWKEIRALAIIKTPRGLRKSLNFFDSGVRQSVGEPGPRYVGFSVFMPAGYYMTNADPGWGHTEVLMNESDPLYQTLLTLLGDDAAAYQQLAARYEDLKPEEYGTDDAKKLVTELKEFITSRGFTFVAVPRKESENGWRGLTRILYKDGEEVGRD